MKQLWRNKKIGFFSAMLLASSALVLLFFLCTNLIIYTLSTKYEETQYLKNYDLAMMDLISIMENQYNEFHAFSGRLLSNNQIDPILIKFLKDNTLNSLSPIDQKAYFNYLESLSSYDDYIRGFFIYSLESNRLYFYSTSTQAFYQGSISEEDLGLTAFNNHTLGVERINELLNICAGSKPETYNFYGFTATIFERPTEPLGFLIPLYHTSEFKNALNRFDLKNKYVFTLTNNEGSTLFTSNFHEREPFSSTKFYTNTRQDRYKNVISYVVEKPRWLLNSLTSKMLMISSILALFILFLFFITFYFSRKNIEYILNEIKTFTLSDLDYRIQPLQSNNEFTQIIVSFNTMIEELQRHVERTYIYEIQHKRSELYALQTSINPHFLYNTLEIIRSQIIQGDTINPPKMLLLLSKVHRNQTNTKAFVTIEYDTEMCENLMELYQGRFSNFDYEFNIDEKAACYGIPKNTIQPFIENYFVHGIVFDRNDNLITIDVTLNSSKTGNFVHLSITNNGTSIDKATIDDINQRLNSSIYSNEDHQHGFALANVYQRLKIIFKSDCSMVVGPHTENSGFRIDIRFPAHTVKEMDTFIS